MTKKKTRPLLILDRQRSCFPPFSVMNILAWASTGQYLLRVFSHLPFFGLVKMDAGLFLSLGMIHLAGCEHSNRPRVQTTNPTDTRQRRWSRPSPKLTLEGKWFDLSLTRRPGAPHNFELSGSCSQACSPLGVFGGRTQTVADSWWTNQVFTWTYSGEQSALFQYETRLPISGVNIRIWFAAMHFGSLGFFSMWKEIEPRGKQIPWWVYKLIIEFGPR